MTRLDRLYSAGSTCPRPLWASDGVFYVGCDAVLLCHPVPPAIVQDVYAVNIVRFVRSKAEQSFKLPSGFRKLTSTSHLCMDGMLIGHSCIGHL
jgi:hypothetical protein